MMRAGLALLAAASGCYLELGSGVLAPTKHGYGRAGPPFFATSGIDTKTSYGRIGGGLHFHAFLSPSEASNSIGWYTGGLQLRNEINLVPRWIRTGDGTRVYHQQFALVTAFSAGLGEGKANVDDEMQSAKYIDIYVGVGLADHRRTKRARWFTPSVGFAANRIWLGDRDPAWFMGAAISLAAGLRLDPDE
jgi:hypothetical protein